MDDAAGADEAVDDDEPDDVVDEPEEPVEPDESDDPEPEPLVAAPAVTDEPERESVR